MLGSWCEAERLAMVYQWVLMAEKGASRGEEAFVHRDIFGYSGRRWKSKE